MERFKNSTYVSACLVGINVVIFLLCTFSGDLLYNIGRLSPVAFFGGKEYYRMISSMFLHADINHLVNNMLLLFGIGAMLEREMGHLRFVCLYFISGVGGQVASLLFKMAAGEWMVGSVGASGAVFGLVGVLLAVILFTGMKMPNVTLPRVIFVIAFTIYSGMNTAGIDNAAHIGGCAVGFLAGMLMCLVERLRGNEKYKR